MKRVLVILVAALFAVNGFSQNCGVYHPTKVGTTLTYTYYEKPNKPDKTCEMSIKNSENTAKGLKLSVDGVVKEKNGKEALKYSYVAWCDGETFYIDMKSMLTTINVGQDLSTYKIESTDLQFPKTLVAGQKLPDAALTLTIDGPVKTGITTNIVNRKVEGFESVTTSAGTFDCVKISYDYNSKVMFIKTNGRAVEWFALNVGTVKSETYDSRGKLLGTNLLTGLK
jgi:hypothetical protein